MREMDPLVWFGERNITPAPRHFTKTTTPSTPEMHSWVLTTLKGRFSLVTGSNLSSLQDWGSYYSFEDPAEAMLFELRWAGN